MSSLRKNIFSLLATQGVNYVLPLAVVPFLARVLGVRNFGRLVFAQALIQYFTVFTDYGFNLSATRAVALVRNNEEALAKLFSAVMTAKTVLMLLGFCILLFLTHDLSVLRRDRELCELTYLSVVGAVLFPTWLFQGMERMHYITVFTLTGRIVSLFFLFVFIRHKSDYNLAAGIQAGGIALGGAIALMSVGRIGGIRICLPRIDDIRAVLYDGWHVFLSTAAISLYTSTNVFVLGLITNATVVGYFSGAEKIVRALQGLINPISQAVYPYAVSLAKKSRESAYAFIGRLIRWQCGGMSIVSISLFIAAKPLVLLLLGKNFHASIVLVQLMAALPVIVAISNILGIQTMLVFNMKKTFSRIVLFSGVLNLMLIVPLVSTVGAEGAALSVLVTEVVVTSLMAVALMKNGVLKQLLSKGSHL